MKVPKSLFWVANFIFHLKRFFNAPESPIISIRTEIRTDAENVSGLSSETDYA